MKLPKRPAFLKGKKRRSAEKRAKIVGPILETSRKRKANGQK